MSAEDPQTPRPWSWRRRLLALVYALCLVGLTTPFVGFALGSRRLLGLPSSVVWVIVCLAAVFVSQLLVFREDAHRMHPWEAEAAGDAHEDEA